ncbi:MAG: 2OG-Fe(II) oxygenase [Planctomycetes bacterium]|nr:2OG-Fe(II) oxygenase [Planctomycetota bacterium]
MNPKRQKTKDRRRARMLAQQAWDAANQGNLDLAEKIIRRAVATQEDNPVLWNDQGVILGLRHKDTEAAKSFAAALSLAPTFADPYAHLATLRIRQGRLEEALALQTQAVEYAPQNASYAEILQAYQALTGRLPLHTVPQAVARVDSTEASSDARSNDWPKRLATLDWHALANRLTRDGCVVIAGLLDASTCEQLCGLFDDDPLFSKTVVMDRPEFGKGVYRYFGAPIPIVVDHLRRAVYPHVALIANEWQGLLGESERFPEKWDCFRDQCHHAGQTMPTPILLKYGPGGFNALHRDLRGALFFPIQMAVVLSPRADPENANTQGFQGGEFLFCDSPEGRKSRPQEIPLGLGDAVLFCTRDRLVRTGGVVGLQPVKHGVGPITGGTRFVLGVPFHEYR